MKPVEVVAISVFVTLCIAALAFAIRKNAKQQQRIAAYASERGWRTLKFGDASLNALLRAITPNLSWTATPIMLIEEQPESVYLFGFREQTKGGRISYEGFASLAERDASYPEQPVTVETRTPIPGTAGRKRADFGNDEFLRKFAVFSASAAAPASVINGETQRILLAHDAEPGWFLSVTIARQGVLVQTHQSRKEAEWDYLVTLAKRLRGALR